MIICDWLHLFIFILCSYFGSWYILYIHKYGLIPHHIISETGKIDNWNDKYNIINIIVNIIIKIMIITHFAKRKNKLQYQACSLI